MEIATVVKANGGCEADRKWLRRLRCSVKDYDWGKIGLDSLVYRVYAANSDYQIDSTRPYAELWMGTHESGPSYLEDADGSNGVTLRSWIAENPKSLGDRVLEKWGCDLPFLFKERQLTDKERLVLKLEKQYPDDIGVISAFFFNYVKLNPGEALYLGANEPHTYLFGECLEVMATSDNVV